MPSSSMALRAVAFVCLGLALPLLAVENTTPPAPNSDPVYQQLRNVALSGEAVSVQEFTLKRDAATFHLHTGTVCFLAPVQGKVTGAVFVGDANMILEPPTLSERNSLRLLTRDSEFAEQFNRAVFRFTDDTYEEMKKAGAKASGGCDPNPLSDSLQAARHNRELRFNLEGRILQDILSTAPGGLFVAFVHGNRYNDKEIFAIDPHGAPPFLSPPVDPRNIPTLVLPAVAPEEVEFLTYDENKIGCGPRFTFRTNTKKALPPARRIISSSTSSISNSIPSSTKAPASPARRPQPLCHRSTVFESCPSIFLTGCGSRA